jgi:hypothetical protein
MLTFPIAWRFSVLVAFGFLIFLVAPLALRQISCEPKALNRQTIESDGHSSGGKLPAGHIPISAEWISATEHQQAAGQDDHPAGHNYRFWSSEWFCGDLKVTDLALVYFTYCLVVVGWFTLRSNERALQEIERARVSLSTLKFSRLGGDIRDRNKVPTVTVGFTNHGKTVARVIDVRLDMRVTGSLPRKPAYSNRHFYVPVGKTIASEGREEYLLPSLPFFDFGPQHVQPDGPLPFVAHFWAYGYIAYLDHLGHEHRHGFVGLWMPPDTGNPLRDASGEGFIWGGTKNYSYDT